MKLRLLPQHHADEREVRQMLATVAVHDPHLLAQFPRPLKKIIALGCDMISVCFESKAELDLGSVARTLRDKYHVYDESLRDNDTTRVAGYLYAVEARAFIFSDSQYGEGFERFTIAHEAGHLFREFVPQVARANQQSLFDGPAKPIVMAMRDTPGQLLCALDLSTALDGALRAEYQRRKEVLREKKANGFAAELLAPFHEVKRLISEHPGKQYEQYVDLVRQHFNVSRKAARVRLVELADEAHDDQEVLDLLR